MRSHCGWGHSETSGTAPEAGSRSAASGSGSVVQGAPWRRLVLTSTAGTRRSPTTSPASPTALTMARRPRRLPQAAATRRGSQRRSSPAAARGRRGAGRGTGLGGAPLRWRHRLPSGARRPPEGLASGRGDAPAGAGGRCALRRRRVVLRGKPPQRDE